MITEIFIGSIVGIVVTLFWLLLLSLWIRVSEIKDELARFEHEGRIVKQYTPDEYRAFVNNEDTK